MLIKVLRECGYEEALLGLSLSFYDHKIPLLNWDKLTPNKDIPYYETLSVLESARYEHLENGSKVFWTDEKYTKAQKIAILLAHREHKANIARDNQDYIRAEKKFLRSICVWLYIQAPRAWWSEYDTYQVGMTKNSSSTMHTLDKRPTILEDYEADTTYAAMQAFNELLYLYKDPESSYYKDIAALKCNLPEGWLQERQICTNYATLQNIINQREGHRLKYWRQHNEDIISQLKHPELIVKDYEH